MREHACAPAPRPSSALVVGDQRRNLSGGQAPLDAAQLADVGVVSICLKRSDMAPGIATLSLSTAQVHARVGDSCVPTSTKSPLPDPDHQPSHVALSSLRHVVSGGRRAAVRTGYRAELRDREALVPRVRRVRPSLKASQGTSGLPARSQHKGHVLWSWRSLREMTIFGAIL